MNKPIKILSDWLSYQKNEEERLKENIAHSEECLEKMKDELLHIQEGIKSVERHIQLIKGC